MHFMAQNTLRKAKAKYLHTLDSVTAHMHGSFCLVFSVLLYKSENEKDHVSNYVYKPTNLYIVLQKGVTTSSTKHLVIFVYKSLHL